MTPPFLRPNDTVGICATARWLSEDQLAQATELITSWGFRVKVTGNVTLRRNQLAGTDAERRQGLQELMDDPDCKAILVARGGYGTVRLVDELDWSRFMQHPKWIAGYSDLTVLLCELNRRGVPGIHSTMPVSFPDCTPEALNSLRAALSGGLASMKWSGQHTNSGVAEGRIVGGNLSVIYSLLGSKSLPDAKNCILLLEDVDEMLYHLDRMMMALTRAGFLREIRGVIIGGLTQMKDNTGAFGFKADNPWGGTAEEILLSFFRPMQIPVALNAPSGHLSDNRAFFTGLHARLTVRPSEAEVVYMFE